MASVAMRVDLSALVDAVVAGDAERIASTARELTHDGADIDVLIGRIGMIAAHGDSEGHTIAMLDAASILSRWLYSFEHIVGVSEENRDRPLPLLVQALMAAAPAVRAGQKAKIEYPKPYFPSDLPEGKSLSEAMHEAVYGGDANMVERILLGLYGTGADYRTMQVRAYDGISTTFQNAGHPQIFAARGFQLLDPVEWGDRAPDIIQWLAPHLPLHGEEPAWVQTVRGFVNDSAHTLEPLRVRLSAPKNVNALPLRQLLLSDSETGEICQAVYDALLKGGASPAGVGSIVALAAADIMQQIGDEDREAFVRAAHGLLFAAAVRLVFSQVQDIDAVPLVFTSAAFVNELRKELGIQATQQHAAGRTATFGGGLLAPAVLDTLSGELNARDLEGAHATARRYLQIGHEIKPLFATIGRVAAQADAAADQGHTLQIVQAAGEEFMAWPRDLADTNIDNLLRVALRAAALAPRNELVSDL